MSRLVEIEARVQALSDPDESKRAPAGWLLTLCARADIPFLLNRVRELEGALREALAIAHTRRLVHHEEPDKLIGYNDLCAACTVTKMVDALAGGEP